jgi:hypothetical protein
LNALSFMIIGAQKAGTTALSHFLAQHPAIAMAQGKEVHLFDAPDYQHGTASTDINNRYSPFFADISDDKLLGEATPIYLYWPTIIPELKRYNPQLKVVVILRDPVARAISHYQMEKSRHNETCTLLLALLLEPIRLWREVDLGHAQRCYSYVQRGLYAKQLEHLRNHFNDDQILVLESGELLNKHQKTLIDVCRFLGVEPAQHIAPAHIFVGRYQSKKKSWARRTAERMLRWRFKRANHELKRLLIKMNVPCDWDWLE